MAPCCGLLLLLFISAGCARPFVQAEKGLAGPELADARQIIAGLKERSDFWGGYQCRFRIKVDSKVSKFSTRGIVFIDGRNFVRFETFTPLGQTAALYVSNENGTSLLIPSEKAIFKAQHPETLIHQFLGVTLPADLFGYALAASVPQERLKDIESRYETGVWHLISNREGGRFEWRITAGPPALQSLFVRSEGFQGRVSYDPPVPLTKEAVPGGIRISSNEWIMEINIEELRPASQFQPSTFHMPELHDVRKVDLDKIK